MRRIRFKSKKNGVYTLVHKHFFNSQNLYETSVIQIFKGSGYSNRSSSVPQVLPRPADGQDMAVHHKVADMLLGREIRARRRAVVRFGRLWLSGERPRRHLRTARENPASGGFTALAQPVDFRGDSRVRGCAPDFVVRGRKTRIRQKLLLTSPSGGFLRGAN